MTYFAKQYVPGETWRSTDGPSAVSWMPARKAASRFATSTFGNTITPRIRWQPGSLEGRTQFPRSAESQGPNAVGVRSRAVLHTGNPFFAFRVRLRPVSHTGRPGHRIGVWKRVGTQVVETAMFNLNYSG